MYSRRFALLLSLVLVFAVPAAAVTLEVGKNFTTPNSSDANIGPVRTNIDLAHPASHTGTVQSVKVHWAMSTCPNALKIKFFRRTGESLMMIAERGPFSVTSSVSNFTMTPVVNVQQGDLIGVARVGNCGNVTVTTGWYPDGYVQFPSDVSGTFSLAAGADNPGGVLSLYGTGTATETMAAVVPAAASIPGAYGSNFKTEMQFFNPLEAASMSVKVVFRREGIPGSLADTTRLVLLDPGEVFSTADVVAAMGLSNVNGSIDLSVPVGQPLPVMLAKVYNDLGAAGTLGLTEEPVLMNEFLDSRARLLFAGATGFLVGPRDMVRTRFNIGIRTLYSGAKVDVVQRNSDGVVIRSFTRSWTAMYYIQSSAEAFLGGPLSASDTIEFTVKRGSIIIYGASNCNLTNDPAIQFVYACFIGS